MNSQLLPQLFRERGERKLDRWKRLAGEVYTIYTGQRIPIAAAGLTYFLTMTFFPLLICLQAMLGTLFPSTEELRDFLSMLLPRDTVSAILDYLRYTAANQSDALTVMALTVVASSSAAAFRTVDRVMGDMRGRRRRAGALTLAFSFCLSLFFLAAIYFALILITTGKWFLELADRHIYFMNLSESWRWARFLLLFALLFGCFSSAYRFAAARGAGSRTLPGALSGSAALLALSLLFSAFLGASARYPLLYGSLASVIILMVWLYVAGNVLFLGCALNVALERTDHAPRREHTAPRTGRAN